MSRSSRVAKLFSSDKKLLSIFLTAGYPNLNDTLPLCEMLQQEGVDFIEVGIPYSDPLADGQVIQETSEAALLNGMSLSRLFKDLSVLREKVSIPIFLMGYFNPVLQFGVENFLKSAQSVGVDGCIIPDLPLLEYKTKYLPLFEQYQLDFVPLITPTTPKKRYSEIIQCTSAFIYAVSSTAVTGGSAIVGRREDYFSELKGLSAPTIVGFGISSKEDFQFAVKSSNGAIIGSAFLKSLDKNDPIESGRRFIRKVIDQPAT